MADDDAKLSYEELTAILKQSTDLQARRGPATFSKEDLLDAAGQLGIDAKTASEVVAAHLARRASTELVPRPFNTRVELEITPDLLSLTIPPLPVTAKTLAPLGFAGVWLAFIALWTAGAAHGSPLFAMFSLPFWAVGIAMLRRFGLPLIQRTQLTLDRDAGELTARPLGRRHALRTSELRVRIGDHVALRQKGVGAEERPAQAVLIEHGVDTIALLDGFSPQEQKWIDSELRAWLANL